jgi:integrase
MKVRLSQSNWVQIKPYLVRYVPSGQIYARFRTAGKLIQRSLKTDRVTHHDLRHLFATRCIESGVDIPTVSRWLGHRDGGALAMKVYGHLRDQHSVAMAQRVVFSKDQAPNVIKLKPDFSHERQIAHP